VDEGEKTLLGTVGVFVSLGWGAIAHLYKLMFSMPSAKRVDDLTEKVERLQESVASLRVQLAALVVAVDRGDRNIIHRRRNNDDDP
jgi:hypothetical protein